VLLIHGGGWIQGDRTQLRGYGILLGRIGYTCVACEYRLAPQAKWPAQIHDVKAALRWMRANAERLVVDPAKIAVSGNSAGGHLSLILAGTPGVAEFEGEGGNAGVSTDVAACIAFYAPALLYSPERELPEYLNFLFGPGYNEATAKGASPLTYASPSFPPTMLITGNKDELVPNEASFMMYRALFDAGVSTELHIYADAPHGFDAIQEFGRQTATLMSLFLDRYVVNPRKPALPVAAATA
jgi:acetyl esterase/lipase